MPTDLDLSALPDALPPIDAAARHARDERELVSLRATVEDLLEEIRRNAARTPAFDPIERRVAVQPAGANAPPRPAEFIAMLAHELRNPMQPIAMAAGMLANIARDNPEVARVHAVLDRQIGHMGRLLDSLLEGGRVASGKIKLSMRPVSLAEIMDAALETSQPGFEERCQNVRLCLPEQSVMLSGDVIRLTQAFANLLNNASRFTAPFGNIVVTATASSHMLEVSIADDGAGIPAAIQPTIFDMFTQGERTLERAPSGLGLGLYLVRTIVDLHGGGVTVASAGTDKGSTFTVTLPLEAPPRPRPPLPMVKPADCLAPGSKILIIEDDIDANEIMAILLEMGGHQVTSRFDGESGLRAALADDFDIVLCDLGLPGLNGFEVIAGLKGMRGRRAPLVIATTGYSDPAQLDLARAAGFDRYLVKPLDVDALLGIISEVR